MALFRGWLPRMPVCHLVLLLSYLWLVGAQSPPKTAGPDPVEKFCMRWWSQSVVKDNVLYIDSGIERFNDSGNLYLGTNNNILSINLTDTWNWKKRGNETGGLSINISQKNVTNPDTGTIVPSLIRGHMFHGPANSTDIYRFGGTNYMYNQSFEGYTSPESSTYPLWTYDPSDSSKPWGQHSISQPWQPNHGAAAEAIDMGLGFYLNGQIDMGTSTKTLALQDTTQTLYTPLEGMLVINLVDFSSANISTSSMNKGTPRVGGTLDYIDAVGTSGILVALGGQIQPGLGGQVANRSRGELIDFKTVDIFDLDQYLKHPSSNGTWYQQTTTGDVPPPRIDFCTVTVAAPDNSSHHIYLYGGIDPITKTDYDDVVILSIPSFTWTNVWPIGESPRLGHGCHRAGKRQMITVGGNVTNLPCDWELRGVALLDLTTIEWGSVFKGEQDDFQVPNQVLGATGGSGNGNATVGEPKQGWTEPGLKSVFAKSRWTVPTSWALTPEPKKTNVGAIAGGIVGGVLGLALIAGGLFFWLRSRRKTKTNELHGDDVPHASGGSDEKKGSGLQGVHNEPVELPGPEAVELNAPRQFVEADHDTATKAAELSGTSTVPGGVHGVPIVRTPGDDLPESPEYTPGLKRPASLRSKRRSSEVARETQKETRKDYFDPSTESTSRKIETTSHETRTVQTSEERSTERAEDTPKPST